jgi:hypothetical protein
MQSPWSLAFATPARTIALGQCGEPITIEARDRNTSLFPVPANVEVELLVTDPLVSFFAGTACAGAETRRVTLPAMASAITVSARGMRVGTSTLTARTAPGMSVEQAIEVSDAPQRLAIVSTPPSPLQGGTCFPFRVEARRADGGAFFVASPVTVSLNASPSDGARFYSNADCSTQTSTQSIPAGGASTQAFARVLVSSPTQLTATAPFDTQTQAVTALPIVRRGVCQFAKGDGGIDGTVLSCPVSPPLAKLETAFLLVQLTSPQQGVFNDAFARCSLKTVASLECQRTTNTSSVEVHWQIIELGSRLSVQSYAVSGCPDQVTLVRRVALGEAFLLRTNNPSESTNFDNEDAPIYVLDGGTRVSVVPYMTPRNCLGVDLQVIEWSGTRVERGFVGMPMGSGSARVSGLPATQQAIVRVQGAALEDGTYPTCSLLVRAELPSATEIALGRGLGSTACFAAELEAIAFERIDFGRLATVQQVNAFLGAGQARTFVNLNVNVDPGRTFIWASGHSVMGQGGGETTEANVSLVSEAALALELKTQTQVEISRGRSGSGASVTFYVVQVE